MMKKEDAIDTIKRSLPSYLAMKGIDTGSNGKKPFRCLNPTHTDIHPSMSINTKGDYPRCHCFSCGANYGTFDLLAIDYHINPDDFNSLLKAGCEVFGLIIDDDKKAGENHAVKRMIPPAKKIDQATENAAQAKVYDFHAQVCKAMANLYDEEEYHEGWNELGKVDDNNNHGMNAMWVATIYLPKQRKIDKETLMKFKVGFSSYNGMMEAYPEYKKKGEIWDHDAIVIPFLDATGRHARYFMLDTFVDRENKKNKIKYLKPSAAGLTQPYFQEFYLTEEEKISDELYIVEGVWSAIELEQAGRHALALCGAQIYKRFLNLCDKHKENLKSTMFYIATDVDTAGEDAAKRIAEGLDDLDLMHVRAVPKNEELQEGEEGWRKDLGEINEKESPENLEKKLSEIEEKGAALRQEKQEKEEENRKAEQESYMQTSAGAQLSDFMAKTKKNHENPSLSTGFKTLDSMLAGGLRQGRMYILGGMSAVGKTAFLIQLSDFLAAGGHDVLYISLEMSQIELMSRSISRESALSSVRSSGETWHAKTAAQIEQGELYANISSEDFSCVSDAIEAYRQYADHIYIVEGNANLDVFTVRDLVQKHINMTGNHPVVITDYMQILAPAKEGQTDKQVADQQIKVLKQTARDLEVPMIVVSSFNRNSYSSGASYSAYKETGAIEYTADALLALQYSGLDGSNGKEIADIAKQRKKDGLPIDVEIVSLKSRQGYEDGAKLAYFSRFNLFLPAGTDIKKISNFTAWQEAK